MAGVPAQADRETMTGEDLLGLGDIGPCELVDGRILPMTPTAWKHGRIELRLAARLDAFVSGRGLGWVMTGEVGIYTARDPDRVRGADIVFLSRARAPTEPSAGFLEAAPDLVAEIVSPSDRWQDVRQKIDEYFAIGVEQVWIVEPENRLVVVYSSATTANRYAEEDVLDGTGAVAGFQLAIRDLFV